MRRPVIAKILPLPNHLREDWKTRADDCLVFGASLAGARKMHLNADLIGYRIHGSNAYANNTKLGDPQAFFERQIVLDRLMHELREHLRIPNSAVEHSHLEFKTIPNPTLKQFHEYWRMLQQHGAGNTGKLRAAGTLIKWLIRSRYLTAHRQTQTYRLSASNLERQK